MLQQLLLMFHVIIAVAIIALVLLQQGKGAEMGAAFGSGASQTVFGSQGSSSFLLKVTGSLAILFFVTSLSLGYLSAHQTKQDPLKNLAEIAAKLPPQQNSVPNTPPQQSQTIPNAGVPVPASNFQAPEITPTSPGKTKK